MAHFIEDRVEETTTTTGTGPYTLAGASKASRQGFDAAGMAVGDFCYAYVAAVDANLVETGEWEAGIYTKTAANTLERTQITASSNANGVVSWAAGTKLVSLAFTAALARATIPGSVGSPGTPAPTPTPTPVPSGVRPYGVSSSLYGDLIFSDEFNGTSLDPTKWNDHLWYLTSQGPTNYQVSNGSLKIWPQPDANGNYIGRAIDTDGKFEFLYGYYEAEMKLVTGKGTWPAFWLYRHLEADRPEIDIMEAYPGGNPATGQDWADANSHPVDYSVALHQNDGVPIGNRRASTVLPMSDLSLAMHKYGLHLDSAGAQFYFDGQPVGAKFLTNFFDRNMYVLFDLWFGSASGLPGDNGEYPINGISNSLEIGYVRVWPLAGAAPAPSPVGTNPIVEFYGASAVWGYQSGTGNQVHPNMVDKFALLNAGYTVTNKGVPGADSKEMLEGSGDMAPYGGWLDIMNASPATHVILMVGTNDASLGRPLVDYEYYITNMVQQAKAAGKKMILTNLIQTLNLDVTAYKDKLAQIAAAENVGLIDTFGFCEGYKTTNGLTQAQFTPDGIHPIDAAYAAIGQYISDQFPYYK